MVVGVVCRLIDHLSDTLDPIVRASRLVRLYDTIRHEGLWQHSETSISVAEQVEKFEILGGVIRIMKWPQVLKYPMQDCLFIYIEASAY